MVRKIASVAVAFSALQASLVSALGLGELKLNSALNQPLVAQVELLNVGKLDNSQLIVELAKKTDFLRAGVEREFFLTNLKFAVEIDSRGNGVINITTDEVVNEPFLDFIIEARWPSGKLLREYTVLLDLPTFSDNSSSLPSTAVANSPVSSQSSLPTSSSGRQYARHSAGDTYKVRPEDTLWEIARDNLSSSDTTVSQAMVAIQRENPTAFIRNNMNLLKAGAVLRLPTASEVASITDRTARQEIAAQSNSWQKKKSPESLSGAQLDGSQALQDSIDSGVDDDGYLAISSDGGETSTAAGGESEGGGSGGSQLQDKLNASLENLDSLKRENDDLEFKLVEMEGQIDELSSLLNLKQEELALLQQKLGDDETTVDDVVDTVDAEVESDSEATLDDEYAEDVDAEIVDADEELLAEADAALAEQDQDVEVLQPVLPEKAVAPTTVTSSSEPAQPFYMKPLVWIAGAALAVLGLLIVMLKRRGSSDEDDEFAAMVDHEEEPVLEAEDSEESFDEAVIEDVAADEKVVSDDFQSSSDDEPEIESKPTEHVKPETGDAIAEADIYVAYGRYQQAVDLLSGAIAAEPMRTDLRTKLLDIYIETRDKEAFQHQYVELASLGGGSAIHHVKEMLSAVDGVSDWLEGMPEPTAASIVEEPAEIIEEPSELSGLELETAGGMDDLDNLDDGVDDLGLDDLGLDDSALDIASETSDELELDDIELDVDVEDLAAESVSTSNDVELDLDISTLSDSEEESGLSLDLDMESDDLDLEFDHGDDLTTPEALAELELPSNTDLSDSELSLDEEFDFDDATDDTVSAVEQDIAEVNNSSVHSSPPEENVAEIQSDDVAPGEMDEIATKLDLARAYIEMGDAEGAKDILDEVLEDGQGPQLEEANELVARLNA